MVLTETSALSRRQAKEVFTPNGSESNTPPLNTIIGTQRDATPQSAPPHALTPGLKAPRNGILHHRVREILWHIPWYGFKTQARLACDAHIAPSTVSRLLRGKELPSLVVALRLVKALCGRAGRALDVGEVFSLSGSYPTPSVCALMRCPGCLPPLAFDHDDNLVEQFQNIETGQWSLPTVTRGGR